MQSILHEMKTQKKVKISENNFPILVKTFSLEENCKKYSETLSAIEWEKAQPKPSIHSQNCCGENAGDFISTHLEEQEKEGMTTTW